MKKRKNRKTATRTRKVITPVVPISELSVPVVQTEITLLPTAPPAAEEPDLREVVAQVEQKISAICESSHFPFDMSDYNIDYVIQGTRNNLKRLRAIKRELSPGFIRRLVRQVKGYFNHS